LIKHIAPAATTLASDFAEIFAATSVVVTSGAAVMVPPGVGVQHTFRVHADAITCAYPVNGVANQPALAKYQKPLKG
jgi:hypothetical protein